MTRYNPISEGNSVKTVECCGFLGIRIFLCKGSFVKNNERIKQSYKTLLLIVFVSFLSVSCGKKGPLYISKEDANIINTQQKEALKKKPNKDVLNTSTDATK